MQKAKVPPVLVLLAAWTVAACGSEAESAADQESLRVIPPAEAAAPEPASQVEAPQDLADEAAPVLQPAAAGRDAQVSKDPVRTAPAVPAGDGAAKTTGGSDAGRDVEAEAGGTPPEPVRTDPDPASMPPTVEMVPEPLAVPVGSRVELELQVELSTKDHPVGAPFTATVAEDLLGGGGVVLLSRGALVHGRVSESRRSPGPDEPASLALALESVEVDGRFLPLVATVTEMEIEAGTRDSDAETAAKVGAGAAAGAILGKILGGQGRDAVRGAVAGAAAGAAVAALTRDGHAVIPQGARVVMVLDERLILDPPRR